MQSRHRYWIMAVILLPLVCGYEGVQECYVGKNCMIGEFVFNDSYTLITSQACKLTVYYPNGSLAVNAASMSNNSNGWHNMSVNYNILGLYRSYMYCNYTGDENYIDKSFFINSSDCYQGCVCVIGEYVYNDSNYPITNQACNISVWYSNGTQLINNQPMTNNSDAWHNYTKSYSVVDVYSALIHCVYDGSGAYIDQSFTVVELPPGCPVCGGGGSPSGGGGSVGPTTLYQVRDAACDGEWVDGICISKEQKKETKTISVGILLLFGFIVIMLFMIISRTMKSVESFWELLEKKKKGE